MVDSKKKHIAVGEMKVYNPEVIYARTIGLVTSGREIDFDSVLSTELAAYPPSMFDVNGLMRVTSKSDLKKTLQVAVSERSTPFPDTVIYDLSALLWVLHWPSDSLSTYVQTFKVFIMQALQHGNVIFVFDRYYEDITKAYLRMLM